MTTLDVIAERVENIKDQLGRLISNFDSEERARTDLKNRSAHIETRLGHIEDSLHEIKKIIYNGGGGLTVRLDRLEQSKNNSRWNLSTLIAGVAVLIALLSWLTP